MDAVARFGFNGPMTSLPSPAGRQRERCESWQKPDAPVRVVMQLEPFRVATLHTHGPVEIVCESGQLWITFEGELEDVVLHAGQRRVLPRPVRDVVLSTAGARCPATFGINPTVATSGKGGRTVQPFELIFG